jgi:hypothetical protein
MIWLGQSASVYLASTTGYLGESVPRYRIGNALLMLHRDSGGDAAYTKARELGYNGLLVRGCAAAISGEKKSHASAMTILQGVLSFSTYKSSMAFLQYLIKMS